MTDKGGEKMNNSKKPGEPLETEHRTKMETEIRLLQLNDMSLCEINGMPIENVQSYSFWQSSDGTALLNLTIRISAETVSTTIQAQTQLHS